MSVTSLSWRLNVSDSFWIRRLYVEVLSILVPSWKFQRYQNVEKHGDYTEPNWFNQYEPMYFRNDFVNIFQGSKLKNLVSLERRDSRLKKSKICYFWIVKHTWIPVAACDMQHQLEWNFKHILFSKSISFGQFQGLQKGSALI